MKSIKTKLKVNNYQKNILAQHAGVGCHAYSWGLTTCFSESESTKKRSSAITVNKYLVPEVKSINLWYDDVSKCPLQQALRDNAIRNENSIRSRIFLKELR